MRHRGDRGGTDGPPTGGGSSGEHVAFPDGWTHGQSGEMHSVGDFVAAGGAFGTLAREIGAAVLRIEDREVARDAGGDVGDEDEDETPTEVLPGRRPGRGPAGGDAARGEWWGADARRIGAPHPAWLVPPEYDLPAHPACLPVEGDDRRDTTRPSGGPSGGLAAASRDPHRAPRTAGGGRRPPRLVPFGGPSGGAGGAGRGATIGPPSSPSSSSSVFPSSIPSGGPAPGGAATRLLTPPPRPGAPPDSLGLGLGPETERRLRALLRRIGRGDRRQDRRDDRDMRRGAATGGAGDVEQRTGVGSMAQLATSAAGVAPAGRGDDLTSIVELALLAPVTAYDSFTGRRTRVSGNWTFMRQTSAQLPHILSYYMPSPTPPTAKFAIDDALLRRCTGLDDRAIEAIRLLPSNYGTGGWAALLDPFRAPRLLLALAWTHWYCWRELAAAGLNTTHERLLEHPGLDLPRWQRSTPYGTGFAREEWARAAWERAGASLARYYTLLWRLVSQLLVDHETLDRQTATFLRVAPRDVPLREPRRPYARTSRYAAMAAYGHRLGLDAERAWWGYLAYLAHVNCVPLCMVQSRMEDDWEIGDERAYLALTARLLDDVPELGEARARAAGAHGADPEELRFWLMEPVSDLLARRVGYPTGAPRPTGGPQRPGGRTGGPARW